MLTDDMRYKIMRTLQANPTISQRELARELGVSLGRVNYCLQALARAGLIKARSFGKSRNKVAYKYLLTPAGLQQKASLALTFLKNKTREYDALRMEIERLRSEVEQLAARDVGKAACPRLSSSQPRGLE